MRSKIADLKLSVLPVKIATLHTYDRILCIYVLMHIVRAMMLSTPLVVTWIIASVLDPATACARNQVTFGPATPAPLDRPMDTG